MKQIQLYKLRISLKLSYLQMANILGISESLYKKVENKYREPSIKFIKKLKKTYPNFDTNIFFK